MLQDDLLPDSLKIAATAWLLRHSAYAHAAAAFNAPQDDALPDSFEIAATAWLLRHSAYAHAAAAFNILRPEQSLVSPEVVTSTFTNSASPNDDSHSIHSARQMPALPSCLLRHVPGVSSGGLPK